jgi:hypothetical protein
MKYSWRLAKITSGAVIGFCAALLLGASRGGLLSDFEKFSKRTVPAGTIAAFGGGTNAIPDGWLLCDGRPINKELHPDLFQAIGYAWGDGYSGPNKFGDFNLPDLRGQFLRGVSGSRSDGRGDPDAGSREQPVRGGNAGNQVGSIQRPGTAKPSGFSIAAEEAGQHVHNWKGFRKVQGDGGVEVQSRKWDPIPKAKDPLEKTTDDQGKHSHPVVVSGWDTETRVQNVYVNYIIKD